MLTTWTNSFEKKKKVLNEIHDQQYSRRDISQIRKLVGKVILKLVGKVIPKLVDKVILKLVDT